MTKSVVNEGKNTKYRRSKLIPVVIVLLIAMLASLTLAWFVQSLNSKGNQITSVGVDELKIALLKQEMTETAVSSGIYSFENPTDGKFAVDANGVKELTDFVGAATSPVAPVLFVDSSSSADPFRPQTTAATSEKPDENFGYDTIQKRLIVRNSSPKAVQVLLGFSINDYFDLTPEDQADYGKKEFFLPEAVRVEVYQVTKQADNTWVTDTNPIAIFNRIGAEELNSLSIRPELPAATVELDGTVTPSDTVYEFHFQLDPGASALYAGGKFTMDLTLDGFGSIGETYYIRDAEDVKNVFGYYEYVAKDVSGAEAVDPAAIDHYDYVYHKGAMTSDNATVVLLNDIAYDGDIRVTNLFNLNCDGYDFICNGTLTIDVGASNTKWGTLDFGATSNIKKAAGDSVERASQLLFKGGFRAAVVSKEQYDANEFYLTSAGVYTANVDEAAQKGVLLNAPNTAVRWIPALGGAEDPKTAYGTQPSGDSYARRFNGMAGGDGGPWSPAP